MMTSTIIDFHTHRTDAVAALISTDPRRFDPQPGRWYSVGFHPWDTDQALGDDEFALLEQCAMHPQVLAIGETGMDNLRGGRLDVQATVLERHLRLAGQLGKPVVIHSVRTASQIVEVRRKAGLTAVPLAIHGMRGNANVARILLNAGCFLSFGPQFNPETVLATPLERLLIETDDSPVGIDEVARRVAHVLGLTIEQVKTTAAGNARRLLKMD